MKKTILFISICFLFSFSFAQKKTSLKESDSTFKTVQLNEVVMSATKFPENKNNVSQPFLVMGAKKMQFNNQSTTAELLSQSGEVLVQKSQLGGGSPVIRGFEANKVLLVVDGVRMNNSIYRAGHLQNILTVDNAILDRAEILFGPSSLVYGSDALGGVMSFTTKNPVLSTTKKQISSTSAFVRYASATSEKTVHADFGFGDQKFASLTSFTYSDFGDLVQGSKYYSKYPLWGKRTFYVQRVGNTDYMLPNSKPENQVQSAYHQYDFLQKFLFKTGKFQHTLNFQYSNTGNINRYDRLTETNGAGIAKNAQWYYGPQKRVLAQWAMAYGKTSLFDNAHTSVGYQDIEESRHNRGFNSAQLNHRFEKVRVFNINADFIKAYPKGEVRYGVEAIFDNAGSSANAENIITHTSGPLDTRYPDGGSHTQTYGLYVTNTYHLTDKLTVNDGFRLTYNHLISKFNDKTFFPFPYNDINQKALSPTGNIGLIYLPKPSWKISALFSTGYRNPNVDDLAKVFESGGGMLIIPNPKLKAERTWNYELGLSKSFFKKYQIGTSVWYTKYSNALTTEPGTLNGLSSVYYNGTLSNVYTVVNKANAYLWGISANVAADITQNISVASVINYTYGRVTTGGTDSPLDHIAPVFGKTTVTAHFGNLKLAANALYNGTKRSKDYKLGAEDNELYSADPVNGYTPSWATFNFSGAYDFNKHLSLQFAVENIADKYYRVFASGLSAPGRNFVVTLRAKL